MGIRGRPGASHNALGVLQTKKSSSIHTPDNSDKSREKKGTYEGTDQNRIIQSSNPARIQGLTVKNVDTLQESQSLQPLQPGRLVNVRRDFPGLSAITEELRGGMTRLAGSGEGECSGGGGSGLRPGIQTRRGSHKTKDVGQHFFLCRVRACTGERTTEGRSDKMILMRCWDCRLSTESAAAEVLSRITRPVSR